MKFNELKNMVIKSPFTIEELFNELFYVRFTTGNTSEDLEEDFFITGNSISLFDIQNQQFCYEECDKDLFDNLRNIIETLFVEEKTIIVCTIGYEENNPMVEQILDNKNETVFLSAYIVSLFEKYLSRYEIQINWAVLHQNQIVGEEDIENNHFHLLLSCNQFNEKFQNFVEDLKDNIFDR